MRRLRTLARPIALAALVALVAAVASARTPQPADGPATPTTAARESPGDLTPEQRELADRAREAFDRAEFARAANLYETLLTEVGGDPAVLYNLATALARDGRVGLAVWRYLQARRRAPRDADIRHNLQLLAPELEQQMAVTPLAPVNWLYESLSADEWAGLAGGAMTLTLLLGAAMRTVRQGGKLRRALRRAAWGALAIALPAYAFALLHDYQTQWTVSAVVVEDGVSARSGPGERQPTTFALPAGTLVKVEDAPSLDWVKIRFADDRVGFVPQAAIRYL